MVLWGIWFYILNLLSLLVVLSLQVSLGGNPLRVESHRTSINQAAFEGTCTLFTKCLSGIRSLVLGRCPKWHGSPPKQEVEEGFFMSELFSLPFNKRNGMAAEIFAGKLRTSILMLSKGEVMLARAPLRFTS